MNTPHPCQISMSVFDATLFSGPFLAYLLVVVLSSAVFGSEYDETRTEPLKFGRVLRSEGHILRRFSPRQVGRMRPSIAVVLKVQQKRTEEENGYKRIMRRGSVMGNLKLDQDGNIISTLGRIVRY